MKAARLAEPPAKEGEPANVREDERRRLARDLHDGPAQALAAALFAVDLALKALERAPQTARHDLLGARELVRDALDDVRSMMAGLRPRQLEEGGLLVALQTLAATPPLWGPAVHFTARGITASERLPSEIELGLFRIAQEAISNARRHSGADQVAVSLQVADGVVVLEVQDKGRGLPVAADRPGAKGGEGLPGMAERAALLGGELTLSSTPGRGTLVRVSVPLGGRGTG
jgi:signal transduction histidine kinase